MDALDGNAIAGQLAELFGAEMTTATGVCGTCGETGAVGELLVYRQAPGTVVRCPTCHTVLMMLTDVRGMMCVGLQGLMNFDGPKS